MITYMDVPVGHPGRDLLSGDTVWLASQTHPRFSYGLHVPAGYVPGTPTPVLVVIHGTQREAQVLREAWSSFSENRHAVVVAPLFPAGIISADDIDSYKMIEAEGIRFDEVLFAMLDDISTRWGLDTSQFYLYGHSGGGQFASRMLLLHPDRLVAVVASAPGRVTLIDDNAPWPRGTSDTLFRFGISVQPDRIQDVSVLLAVGEIDEGGADLAAQQDSTQDGYGETRTERLNTLAENLRAHGVAATVQLLPGAGHEGHPAQSVAQDFFSTLIQGRHP